MATPFADNFESYTPGALAGQGGWTTYGYSTQKVGAGGALARGIIGQAAYNNNNNEGAQSCIYKEGTPLPDGRTTFYLSTHRLPPGSEYLCVFVYGLGNGNMGKGVRIWFYDHGIYGEGTQLLASPQIDTWYCVEVEWKSDNTFRVRINNGSWSAWIAGAGQPWPVAGLGRVGILSMKYSTDIWFIDEIAEYPLPPLDPSALIAAAISGAAIDLAWTSNSGGSETGFKVERKTGVRGAYAQIATTGLGVTDYSDSDGIVPGAYYYRVRAYNDGGDSYYSAPTRVIIPGDSGQYKTGTVALTAA